MESIKNELSERLRRVCDITNRIIASEEIPPLIEKDLLLQELRNMYGAALRIENSEWQSVVSSSESLFAPEEESAPEAPVEPLMSAVEQDDLTFDSSNSIEEELLPPDPVTKTAETIELPDEQMSKEDEKEAIEVIDIISETDDSEEEASVAAPAPTPVPVPAPATTEVHSTEAEVASVEPAPVKIPEPEPISEPQPAKTAVNEEPHQPSLFDYLKAGDKNEESTMETLGDRLGKNESSEWRAESVNKKKVDDLRTIININDKFSFMSELFHSNMKAYNDFILLLNATADRASALAIVEEVAKAQHWDNNSLVVNTFYKIFDRKF